MDESDLASADELRRLAGWNQVRKDWQYLLELEPEGCLVASVGCEIVGTVTTTRHGPDLAWIGMLLVHPDYRNHGIGTLLLQSAIALLESRGVASIWLDATPAGQPLYEKSGFVTEWTLTRFHRPARGSLGEPSNSAPPEATRRLCDQDWDSIEAMDAIAFGAPRSRLIRGLTRRSRSAQVWPEKGPVGGWGLIRNGASSDYLGPVSCMDPDGGACLIDALLSAAEGRAVTWDIPDPSDAARSVAVARGFSPIRPLLRMRRGIRSLESRTECQFAIADPSVG